jgi:UDP-N-acetylmuramoyl-tripeptide--D-alanyl-D-alanine ligase
MSFWTTEKVATALGLKLNHPSKTLSDITTDSRQVKPGSVFIAIKGDTHDGHQFIETAIKAGASAVISEIPGDHASGEFFQVPSTMTAIRTLAHVYRKEFSIPMIAVVGASILSAKYTLVTKTLGSQNGFLGIPLTILSLPLATDAAVIEIGIDDIGAMDEHLALVEPTHVILTKIGPEHLHQLKTVEIAAEEELKAFDYALTQKTLLAINLSDEYVNAWFQKHHPQLSDSQFLTYSLEKTKAPEFLGIYPDNASELTVQNENLNATFNLPLPGVHHAHNLLAAITVSQFFKLSVSEIRAGLSTFKTAYGRTEIHALKDGIEVIGDYYNSNPTSLEAALNLLISKKGRSEYHAVLGDMLELGDHEEKFHREIAPWLKEKEITSVWLYGPRMQWLKNELDKTGYKNVQHFLSHDELIQILEPSLKPNSQILIKGSRGMKMEKVMEALLQGKKKS